MDTQLNIDISSTTCDRLNKMPHRKRAKFLIDFFSGIPEDQWTTHKFTDSMGRHCARGHAMHSCYWNLDNILGQVLGFRAATINDGFHPEFNQVGPKNRILAALERAKNTGRKDFTARS